jgi:hypothetical protein
MGTKLLQFCAIVLTSMALVPSGTHFFELPNKIGLGQDAYFTVQGIYRGWALFGIALLGALLVDGALALLLALRRQAYGLPLLAFLLVGATLAIFFVWIFPVNQATMNWTAVPADWEALRTQWEYGHAVNAVLTFSALCCLTWSVIARDEPGGLPREEHDVRGRAHHRSL